MNVLFDADILVFRCAFAAEYQMWFLAYDRDETNQDGSPKEFDGFKKVESFRYNREAKERLNEVCPGQYSREEGHDYQLWSETQLEPFGHAVQNLNTLVDHILSTLGHTEFDARMFLSPYKGENFRYAIATTLPYKGNRDRTHRPTYEKELRDYIIEHWDTTVAEGEEADDLLGIEQTRLGDNSIIVTLDKDLDQIPGMKHNFMYDRTYEVTPEQAATNFHIQLLMGDTTDNIPGLPGIGIGKARKALHGLSGASEELSEVCRQYQIHSGKENWQEYLLEQGNLLHIRRYPGESWYCKEIDQEDAWDSANLTLY
jgi:hypothetical protein